MNRKKQIKYSTTLIFLTLAMIFFASCSPALKVVVHDSGYFSYNVIATIEPSMIETVRSFSGTPENVPLFNTKQIQNSLEIAGMSNVSVKTPDNNSLQVYGQVKENQNKQDTIHNVLHSVPGAISYGKVKKQNSTLTELRLTLSQETMAKAMELLPIETVEYVELLSAPVFTGEQLTPQEYIDLIAAIYGNSAASVLAKSQATVEIEVPSKILNANVSVPHGEYKTNGNTVLFTVPLAELLAQSQAAEFVVHF